MAIFSLRKAAIFCLVIWAAIWLLFLTLRFSALDIRDIPGAGMIMLSALLLALVAPIAAAGLAGVALIRQPAPHRNWLVFGCAVAALFGQVFLFLVSRWM